MSKRGEDTLYHGIITTLVAAFVALQAWMALGMQDLAVRVAVMEQILTQKKGEGHEPTIAHSTRN